MTNDQMCSWCKTVIKSGDPIHIDGEGCDYHAECMMPVYDYLDREGVDALCEVIDGPGIGVRGEARRVS